MTERRVRSANSRLQRRYKAPKGPRRKPRKGKERVGPSRSNTANSRPGTADSGETYQDEVSFRDPALEELILRSDDD